MRNWIISIISFALLGSGIWKTPAPSPVVTEITVEWVWEDVDHHRIYRDPDKLNRFLLYLRSLTPRPVGVSDTPPEEPEYTILLTLSDGSQTRYTQYGLSSFLKNDRPRQRIAPEDGIRLPLILAAIPSDL